MNAGTQRRILLVDDDEAFCNALKMSLGRRGIESEIALRRQTALMLAQTHHFTDITIDLNMGDESGLQLIAPLRKLQPHASILVLTGYASIVTTVQAMKLGADNYLAKPVNTNTLLQALESDGPQVNESTLVASTIQHDAVAPHDTLMSVSRLEWEHIQRALAEHQGNISATARALHMHRRTLQRKLAKKPVAL